MFGGAFAGVPGFRSLVPGRRRERVGAGLSLEYGRPLACGPYGPRGFESHSRRHKPIPTEGSATVMVV